MNKDSMVKRLDISADDIFADINQIKTGIAIYDKDLKLIFANETIRNYLPTLYAGLDSGASMMDSIKAQIKIVHPDIKPQKHIETARYIHDKITSSGTIELKSPAGLNLKSTYDKTSRGTYVITTTDVTARVKNAKKLAEARLEAVSANTAKSEFLANMSHEIRTPLSGVFMAAQLLQHKLMMTNQSELSALADILVGSGQHLSEIINNVLDMSKIEAGQVKIILAENSLTEMLRAIKTSQDHVAQEAGLELKLVIDSRLPECLLYDSVRVRQCVTNLVTNALKFTESGYVTIAVLFDPQTYGVTIHVVDTGVGISADECRQVFDQFAQTSKKPLKPHTGTGLGLTISRKLARLMGGDVTLKSKLGMGSIFSLTFASKPVLPIKEALSYVA